MTVEESSSIRTFGTHRWVCYAWATAATAATAAVPQCSSSGTAGGFLRICLAAATGLCDLAAKDIYSRVRHSQFLRIITIEGYQMVLLASESFHTARFAAVVGATSAAATDYTTTVRAATIAGALVGRRPCFSCSSQDAAVFIASTKNFEV
eukprot:CAMPEP_0170482584 /NCGR_PEP_ID=MMETSP0208-20121228/2537_1 /TAXON_ID=197538 /ORGANISM="Strombidium inclinatum, Strain S3" /LENGTH=150 /DNA_ID=CAMNT_0010755437 /DNA_START=581 /DNA_END=1033 /DNA_ORIENTATION=+